MTTSIVIPLGHGSRNNDMELRYCLRSIEKHLTGYGDIFIVGECPTWLQNVIHIPFDEGIAPKTYEKERNIFNKIMAACADDRVSEWFLFMNDDHYLLDRYQARIFPYYHDSTLNCYKTVTEYKHTIRNTIDHFEGALVGNFDVHCPIVYKKELLYWAFKLREPVPDWSKHFGYCIKSTYCDINRIIGDKRHDLKINEPLTVGQIKHLIAGRSWFSIGDKAFNGEIRQVLQELYPKKSRYEK